VLQVQVLAGEQPRTAADVQADAQVGRSRDRCQIAAGHPDTFAEDPVTQTAESAIADQGRQAGLAESLLSHQRLDPNSDLESVPQTATAEPRQGTLQDLGTGIVSSFSPADRGAFEDERRESRIIRQSGTKRRREIESRNVQRR